MAVTIATLNIKLSATTAALRRGFRKAGDSVRKFGKRARSAAGGGKAFGAVIGRLPLGLGAIATAAGPAAAGIAAFAAAATAAAVVTRSVVKQFGEVDRIAKFSDEVGFSTEALVGYQLGAELTGVKVETLEKGLQRFSRQIGEAKVGTTESVRAFADLGLTVEDLNGLSPDAAFKKTAEAIKNLPGPAEKAAAAYRLFGRQGQDLLTFLDSGASGLDEFQRRAKQLGLGFTRFDGGKIEAANDAVTELGLAFTGMARSIAVEVAPAVKDLAGALTDAIPPATALFKELAREPTQNFRATIISLGFLREQLSGSKSEALSFGDVLEGIFALRNSGSASSFALKQLGFSNLESSLETLDLDARIEASQKKLVGFSKPFDAIKDGADKASAEAVKAAERIFDQAEKSRKELEKWNEGIRKTGQRLTSEFQTPLEKATERIRELKDSLSNGGISQETYSRGFAAIAGNLSDARKEQEKFNQLQNKNAGAGGVIRSRSSAGRAALFELRANLKTDGSKQKEAAKEQTAAVERQTAATEELVRIAQEAPQIRAVNI